MPRKRIVEDDVVHEDDNDVAERAVTGEEAESSISVSSLDSAPDPRLLALWKRVRVGEHLTVSRAEYDALLDPDNHLDEADERFAEWGRDDVRRMLRLRSLSVED